MAVSDVELTFEQAYSRLEELLAKLDEGGLSLEEALKCYEEASALAARCNELLDAAELRIRQVRDASEEGVEEADLAPEEDEGLPF